MLIKMRAAKTYFVFNIIFFKNICNWIMLHSTSYLKQNTPTNPGPCKFVLAVWNPKSQNGQTLIKSFLVSIQLNRRCKPEQCEMMSLRNLGASIPYLLQSWSWRLPSTIHLQNPNTHRERTDSALLEQFRFGGSATRPCFSAHITHLVCVLEILHNKRWTYCNTSRKLKSTRAAQSKLNFYLYKHSPN